MGTNWCVKRRPHLAIVFPNRKAVAALEIAPYAHAMDDSEGIAPESTQPAYQCPECSEWVAAPAESNLPVLECPACHAQFFVSQPDESAELDEDEAEAARARSAKEDELNAVKIRQLSALRRGAYRSRSYCIIASGALVVCAIKLVAMTIRHVRYIGWQARPIGYLLAAVAAGIAAGHFVARIAELNRELRQSALSEPESPPDFSTLSDGSQQWKNLEQM